MRAAMVSLALLAVASGCGPAATSAANRASGPTVVALASVESQVAGHPVVFLFTAPGCESCAVEARALAASAGGRPEIRLVGVDLSNDNPAAFAEYISAIGLANSKFMWTIDQDGSFARRYGIVSLSSTVFIDSGGSIRFVNAGPQDDKTLSDELDQLV